MYVRACTQVSIDVTPLSAAASSSRASLAKAIGGAANAANAVGLGIYRSAEAGSTSNGSAASEDQEEGGGAGQEAAAVAGNGDDSAEMELGFISSSSDNDGACIGEEESPEEFTSSASPDPPPAPIKMNLSLSVYWTVMVLVVVCLSEHQRRTEGLVLRRIKTFCLAGTVIGALKMTRKLTQVCEMSAPHHKQRDAWVPSLEDGSGTRKMSEGIEERQRST